VLRKVAQQIDRPRHEHGFTELVCPGQRLDGVVHDLDLVEIPPRAFRERESGKSAGRRRGGGHEA
jgi:hypothetical protein